MSIEANVVQKYTESIYEIITFAFVLFSVFQSQSKQGFIVYLAHIRTKNITAAIWMNDTFGTPCEFFIIKPVIPVSFAMD